MGIVTIVTFIRYLKDVEIQISKLLIVLIIGALFGGVGSKIMKKIPAKHLNLISGIIVTAFAIYSLIRG